MKFLNQYLLNAIWNIFDGGKGKAKYKYNKEKAKESKILFSEEKSIIRKEVEESFYKLQTSSQDIATTTREVLAAREALRLARLRVNAGITTQREIVNNQRDLTQSEVRRSDAITSYNTSLSQLSRQTGINPNQSCNFISTKTEKPPLSLKEYDLDIDNFSIISPCPESQSKIKS